MPKDKTVADLDRLLKDARSARSRLEPVWYMNLAYYQGEQWVAWDGRALYRPPMPRSRITVVDNRIQPAVRTEIAKMTKNRPVFTVTPNSPDEEDANAARLGEQLMRYLWKHLNMQQLSSKALHWSRICCAGFLKTYWDPSKGEGRDVLIGPDQNILTDQQGKPLEPGSLPVLPGVTRKRIAQGDICVEVRSPFQMYPDPLADTFEEAEWLIEESIKSPGYIRSRYGVEVRADTPANPGMIEGRLPASNMGTAGSYKGVKIREYWCKPNDDHPNGCRAVWLTTTTGKSTDSQELYRDENPFDPMPYVMFSNIPVPGRMWPTSVTEQLRGPQTELNKVKSQIAENRNRVGNPTTIASKQAVQSPEKLKSALSIPGGLYLIDDVGSPNNMPQILQAPPLPAYVVDEIARIEESIEQIAGQHEVTSAQVPPGVTAASAINLLMEADNTRLGPAISDYEYQLSKFGQKVLNLAAKYYTDARTIKIGGDNGAWQIFDFRGSMLGGNTHVEVQAGSAFPQSQAAKQAWLQDLMTFFVQSGNPPQGRTLAQFLQDSQIGGAERLVEEYTINETQVNRENALMARGQQLPINDYDDDQAHVANHTDFQKQPHYARLIPPIQQIFEQHVEMHRQRLAAQQQQQMQQQMQMQGQPSPEQQQQMQQAQMAQQAQQAQMQQAQAQQQLEQQAAQLQLKAGGQIQDQGLSAAQAEQQQRQSEELHQQKLRHAEEQHQSQLSTRAEQARAQAEAMLMRARQQGANRGKGKAA